MTLLRTIPAWERVPRWWGVVRWDPCRACGIIAPVGISTVFRIAYLAWGWVTFPFPGTKRWERRYREMVNEVKSAALRE